MTAESYLITFFVILVLVLIISAYATYLVKREEYVKKIKVDIDKDQMVESEKKIKDFLIKNDVNSGYTILEIANILNVQQGGIDPQLKNQACMKEVGNTGRKIVYFKEGLTEKEKLFIFAHELAHLINGDSIPVTRPEGSHKSHVEQCADYTAAALLMPFDEVHDYLSENEYVKASAMRKTRLLRGLCEKYNVTEVIALRRVKEIQTLELNFKRS